MVIGKVTGSVVATRKDEKLVGSKFLVIEPLHSMEKNVTDRFVAVDNIGAGIGDIVLVSTGSAAPRATRRSSESSTTLRDLKKNDFYDPLPRIISRRREERLDFENAVK